MKLREHFPVIGSFPMGPVPLRGITFPPSNWIAICTFKLHPEAIRLQSLCHAPDLPQRADQGLWLLKEWKQSASLFADTGDDKYLLRLAPLVERDEEVVLILLMPNWPGF